MKISTRAITLSATLAALCFVTGAIPFVFFLPVTVAATTLAPGIALFVGLAFGAVSVMYSFVMPMSMVSTAFMQAPYIAVIARVLAALGAVGVYALMNRILKPDKSRNDVIAVSVSAAAGSVLNTALVVSAFAFIMPDLSFGGVTMIVAIPEMLISGVIECVCMAVLTPPVSITLKKTVLKNDKKFKPQVTPRETPHADDGGASRG